MALQSEDFVNALRGKPASVEPSFSWEPPVCKRAAFLEQQDRDSASDFKYHLCEHKRRKPGFQTIMEMDYQVGGGK
jgi:hypothetical protein